MSNNALRYNQGKPDYTLIDFKSLEPMVRVLEFGANKYSRDNWRKGLNKQNLLASLHRHVGSLIDKVNSGQDEVDNETLLHEIGHIMCNCMFYSALHVTNEKPKEMSKDNIDWDALERAERQIGGKSPKKAPEKEETDWEHEFFLEHRRFPNSESELDSFIYDRENEEEQDEEEEYDSDIEYEEEESYEEEEEEVDELDFSDAVDPIQAIIEKGDQMERATRPKQVWVTPKPREVNPAPIVPKKEKPVIVLQKSEKNDSFVDGFVTNDPRVRGLGFRTQDLV